MIIRFMFVFMFFVACVFGETQGDEEQNNIDEKNSVSSRIKDHFFDREIRENRLKEAENSYKHYMKLIEHEGIYFVYSYSLPPYVVYGNNIPDELKFQISFKIPIWRAAFWSKGSLFLAYTQTSWFQRSNYRYSSPVRDTNYKPQIFYSYPGEWNLFGGILKELRVGLEHFSNGIGGDECFRANFGTPSPPNCRSRSVGNRLFFSAIWERGGFGIWINAWPYVPDRRDNLDIVYTLGYADARLYYRHKKHLLELQIGPIISNYARYHGYVRFGYSYSISPYVALYGQYFFGYMDSLYEYNILASRIGVGIRAIAF